MYRYTIDTNILNLNLAYQLIVRPPNSFQCLVLFVLTNVVD